MMPRTRKTRQRPPRGRPSEPRRSNSPVATDPKEWVFIPAPALVDAALFQSAQNQLRENRRRARLGRRRPGYLLQGLTCCAICGYAYYGKTTRQRGAGHCLKDFYYYRCSGTDGYRFGGERICSNPQVHGEFMETAVWREVCDLLANPRRLEQQYQDGSGAATSLQNSEDLKVQRRKLQHGLERIIDSFAEGLIDKEQFTSRINRTKSRITELDAKINADTGGADRQERMRGLASRLRDLAANIGPHIADADWERRREMIRTLVQRIEIGPEKVTIVFRVSPDDRGSGPEPVVVTLSRA